MARVETADLDFSNLAEIDQGRMNKLLSYHLQRVAVDCQSRPFEKGARKVSLEFTIKPEVDEDGECTTAMVQIEAKSKVPTHRSKGFQMAVSRQGFKFNKDFPDRIDQPALFKDEEGPRDE